MYERKSKGYALSPPKTRAILLFFFTRVAKAQRLNIIVNTGVFLGGLVKLQFMRKPTNY